MNTATRTITSVMGAVMALAGLEHGIGEILQGSTAPAGLLFPSWGDAAFFRSVSGEPAMTIIPNLLVSGILTVLLALVFLVWVIKYIGRKHGGAVLILISIALLLVGGGIFPPVFGILIGLLATRIHSPLNWWRCHIPVRLRMDIGKGWPWSLSACVFAWLLLLPGSLIMDYFLGINDPGLVLALMLCAFGMLFLTVLIGFAHDSSLNYVSSSNIVVDAQGFRSVAGCL